MTDKRNDEKRLAWVRSLRCCLDGHKCEGPMEAHHPTGAGLALKADDSKAFPLCVKHHRERHDHQGYFKELSKAERKLWEAEMVATYEALWSADTSDPF